jgi:hypothetical protein
MQTLEAQSSKDFEVIIVDNSFGDTEPLRQLVRACRARGMRVRLLFIDPAAHPLAHPPSQYGGAYNPALAQNIGARMASGDILCLTSPEVINSRTNVEVVNRLFKNKEKHFVLGWIDEKPVSAIGTLVGGISTEKIKDLCRVPGNGAMCRDDVPSRPWKYENYFLGFIRKSDYFEIGGVEEGFMRSIAYEDNFFAHCCVSNGIQIIFNDQVAGIHLSHSRGYQENLVNANQTLWLSLKERATVANIGWDWGSASAIKEEF